jgi:hypothetical protein
VLAAAAGAGCTAEVDEFEAAAGLAAEAGAAAAAVDGAAVEAEADAVSAAEEGSLKREWYPMPTHSITTERSSPAAAGGICAYAAPFEDGGVYGAAAADAEAEAEGAGDLASFESPTAPNF